MRGRVADASAQDLAAGAGHVNQADTVQVYGAAFGATRVSLVAMLAVVEELTAGQARAAAAIAAFGRIARILGAFDTHTDDPQLALEAIQRIIEGR